MTMADSVNFRVVVKNPDGRRVRFDAKRLGRVLESLTSNSSIINRAGVLILMQLASYKVIKIYDLKCIIYRTLKQLSYHQLARQYYYRQLN